MQRWTLCSLVVAIAVEAGLSVEPATASSCDFVLKWDERTITDCVEALKSEARSMQMEIRTLSKENEVLRGWLCLLAQELSDKGLKGDATALITDDACAELKAKAAKAKQKKVAPGEKPKKN
jgi:hypothetical protein